jgi:3-oxoacyl-[acyl-carrier protein] reductase
MKIDLTGKTALITGATGDLGRVMVRTLAECGASVGVHYLQNRAKADELCESVKTDGGNAVAVQADVTDFDSVRAMQAEIADALGPPDIIVTNAVIQYDWKPALDQPVEDFESQYRSSVLHNVFMAKAFVPAMIDRGWGRVVGINTECSLQCWPNQSAYASGKHGMNGFLETLAKEIGPQGVTVNQVAPGWMYSDRDREQEKESGESARIGGAYGGMVPLRHRGEDQDIANMVAFLASDLAKFITGAFIPVNGGGATVPAWLQ